MNTCNISSRLRAMAGRTPSKKAVVFRSNHLTFEQLDRDSDECARGFEQIGIRRGVKTLLMVKPGLEFISITFALFKVGAVPVFGALVGAVAPGSLGEKTGLKSGDIITEINLRPISNADDLEKAVSILSSGSRATIVFLRGEKPLRAEIVI